MEPTDSSSQLGAQAHISRLETLLAREQAANAALTQQIAEARAQINITSASVFYKLAYLLFRLKHQGLSPNSQDRKDFRRWLRTRTPSQDGYRRFHPLMLAVDLLDGKYTLANLTQADQTQTLPQAFRFIPNAALGEILSRPYEKFDIIMLGILSFDFRHQRPQHFAQRLARKGHRVFYINADYGHQYRQDSVEENLWQVTFRGYGAQAIWATDWQSRPESLRMQLDKLVDENAIRDAVVIVDYPNWVYAAEYLRTHYGFPMVSDYMDDFTGFLNPAEDVVRSNCCRMLRACDSIVASSRFLYDIAAQYSENVTMIRNGTEFDYFHQAYSKHPKNAARPKIGYYGAISQWFHADIVCRVAERFPHCDVVLVGEVAAHRRQLEQYENIHLVGEVPYNQLLPWVEGFDVCLIPFDTSTDLIQATNPVKFYEYLSAGKKIVATEIPELARYGGRFAYLENDPEAFCDAVAVCLQGTDTLASPEECFTFARANDWDARAALLETVVHDLYPKISIIVLCYQQLEHTKQCVDSILHHTAYPNYQLILVDNGSTDGTPDYLRKLEARHRQIKAVLNTTNRGFAGGNNDGLKIADGDYLVLLNNDTLVSRGWLTGMLKHFINDSTVGLVGPVTNAIGNEARIPVPYTNMDTMAQFAHQYTMYHMGEEFEHHGMLAMYCLMMSRKAYETIGPLDEHYGIGMFEDDDYSLASEKAGFRNVMAEDVFIHHFGSVSFKVLEEETYRQVFETNKAYFEDKWGQPWQPPVYRPGVE